VPIRAGPKGQDLTIKSSEKKKKKGKEQKLYPCVRGQKVFMMKPKNRPGKSDKDERGTEVRFKAPGLCVGEKIEKKGQKNVNSIILPKRDRKGRV